jgi:hypothetical protein
MVLTSLFLTAATAFAAPFSLTGPALLCPALPACRGGDFV